MPLANSNREKFPVSMAESPDSLVQDDGTTRAQFFVVINTASNGNNTLNAALSGALKIRILAGVVMAAGSVNVTFQSGTGGTAITGPMPLIANVGWTMPYNPKGWFETAPATLLNLNLSNGVQVSGFLTCIGIA